MAQRIEVAVPQTAFVLSAGDISEFTATVHNRGQTVDQLTLSIEGLEPRWYTIPVSSVALFPNDRDSLRIILNPPQTPETRAGLSPFRIKVTSRENPDDVASVDLKLEIRGLSGLELSISPPSAAGRKGNYHIIVNNKGASDTAVSLEVSDAGGKLQFQFKPDRLTIPGNGRAEVSLEVKVGWLALFSGGGDFVFDVLVLSAGADKTAGEVLRIQGKLVCGAWYQAVSQAISRYYRALTNTLSSRLARPPLVTAFEASTEDKSEFKLSWSVKRASEVRLDGEEVDLQGEKLVRPAEVTKYTLTASNKYGSSSRTVEVQPPPPLTAKGSERVRVSLVPSQLQASAGVIPVQAILKVQNLGDFVDKFTAEIEGLDTAWYVISPSTVALMPQATGEVQISLQPPKKKGVKSRISPFAVTVRSQSVSDEATCVVGQLGVMPSVEFKLAIRPFRVTGHRKGTFRVALANTGVTSADFTLEATDLDERLQFCFQPDKPTVAAWDTLEVPMIARPRRGAIVGEKKRYDITVTATTSEGNRQVERCELHHSPLIGSWRRIVRLVGVIIILAALGAVLHSLLQLGGGWGMFRSSPPAWLDQLVL